MPNFTHEEIYRTALAVQGTTVLRHDTLTGEQTVAYVLEGISPEFHGLVFAAPTMYVMLDNQQQALLKLEKEYSAKGLLREAAHFQNLSESLRLTMLLATEGLNNVAEALDMQNKLKNAKPKGKAN